MAKNKVRAKEIFKTGRYIKTLVDENNRIIEVWYYNRRYFQIFKRGRLTSCKLVKNWRELEASLESVKQNKSKMIVDYYGGVTV